MRQAARVLSTDALGDLRASLARFTTRGAGRLARSSAGNRTTRSIGWISSLTPGGAKWTNAMRIVLRCRSELAVARSAPETWRSAAAEREIDLRKAIGASQGGRGKGRGRTPLETRITADR